MELDKEKIKFEIPKLVERPVWSERTEQAALCLDGIWKVEDLEDHKKYDVKVPSDMTIMQRRGLSKHYAYEKVVELPYTESEKIMSESRFVLTFEAVNAFADVYIDDTFICRHKNGFLTWDADITEAVKGKKSFRLKLICDEESDIVSTYSHGGILHSVNLYILPQTYLTGCHLTPLFDEDMEKCLIRMEISVQGSMEDDLSVEVTLIAPDGKSVLSKRQALEPYIDGAYRIMIPVPHPVLWDAEHPRLYLVRTTLYRKGEAIEMIENDTGLRKIERKGNRVFINQQEVKLHGSCRHETSATNGRATTREQIDKDIALFKEANCNYIRTSHYPPSTYFLEQCDRHGIYVEDELALAFIARSLPYTQRDIEETGRYLSHFAECYARDYNHPSVIIWSLANESFGGYNFDILNRFVHKTDPMRLTKFSYPMTIREEHEMPDIWSIHYSEYDTDLAKKRDNVSVGYAPGKDMPVLHDEYAHVPCYNREEIRRDPAVRVFWGEGLKKFWDNIWKTEGALGGAIWAGIDETDIYTGGNTTLEWGIIDAWRRKKPEFYMVRKAYSPIRVIHYQLERNKRKVLLILENRFCHTNLTEVTIRWKTGAFKGQIRPNDTKPGEVKKMYLELPNGASGDIFISFFDANENCVDEMLVADEGIDTCELAKVENRGSKVVIDKDAEGTCISVQDVTFHFSARTGLLNRACVGERCILTGGPILNVPYLKLGEWELFDFDAKETMEGAVVKIKGTYTDTLDLEWKIEIRPDGSFDTHYTIYKLKKHLPKQLKLRVGVDAGGLDELGVAYLGAPSLDSFYFKRRVDPDDEASYTYYPKDHIARNEGVARRLGLETVWGEEPKGSWSEDMKNDLLYGYYDAAYKGSNDFRSTKSNLSHGYLYGNDGSGIAVIGGREEINVRLETVDPPSLKIREDDPGIIYTGKWYRVEDKKESDHGTEMWSHEKGAAAECSFTGTGIVWYGPNDTTYGMANVYIDGKLSAENISLRVAGVDFSCSSVGYDKRYHLPIFSIDGLNYGEHTIRIEAAGKKARDASDTYIVIDYLRVLTGKAEEDIRINMNLEYAYPHISWGNYRKAPITIENGSTGVVHNRLLNTTKVFQIDSESEDYTIG